MVKNEIAIGMNGSMLDEHPTGVGVYSYNLINQLSSLCWNDKWQKLTVFSPTRQLLDTKVHVVKLPGLLLSSRYGKIAALMRFLWNTFYYPFQARQFDLLISPTTHGSFLLNNQVITIHDLLSLRYNNISRHQRFYFKYLLPKLVSRAKLIVTVSETTKKDVIHFLNCPEEKVKVIYNGYDHTRYFFENNNSQAISKEYGVSNYLLAVGPTYPHKNFDRLINAYNSLDASLKKDHPLVIAGGKKSYRSYLKELVNKLGLQANVHFLGYVPVDLMPSLYREATALVFPSLYEGFGIPLLEAMACGCPVIASGTSSIPEVCGDAAMYFDPSSEDQIAVSIQKVLGDKSLRSLLIANGLQQSSKFSWEKTARELKSLIENNFIKPNNNQTYD